MSIFTKFKPEICMELIILRQDSRRANQGSGFLAY